MLYKKQLIPTTELSWKLKIVHSRTLKDFAHVTTAKCANFVKAFVDTEAVRECFLLEHHLDKHKTAKKQELSSDSFIRGLIFADIRDSVTGRVSQLLKESAFCYSAAICTSLHYTALYY